MLLDPDLGYYDEGLDLTDAALYAAARRRFGEATTLPPAGYRSKVFSALEDNRIWTRSWVAVGLQQQIPAPGDLLPFTIGYHGVHLQREADGSIVGRFNKAQHGGCRSVPLQCQTGSRTRCSFTSCGFSRDRGVIPAQELDDDRSGAQQYLGLVPERLLPVRVGSWGPVLFACLDPRTPALGDGLVGLEETFPSWPSAPLRLLGSDWLEVPANWKLMAPALRELLGPGNNIPWPGIEGTFAVESWPYQALTTALPQSDQRRLGSEEATPPLSFAWLFPNLVLLRLPGLAVVLLLQPLSMSETQLRLLLLAAGDLAEPQGDAVSSLRAGWRALVAHAGELAGAMQRDLGAWGTPRRPGTEITEPPLQDNPLSWLFQAYLIDRILDARG